LNEKEKKYDYTRLTGDIYAYLRYKISKSITGKISKIEADKIALRETNTHILGEVF
jgi:hypothetical protein